jgi:hypothetical protein
MSEGPIDNIELEEEPVDGLGIKEYTIKNCFECKIIP